MNKNLLIIGTFLVVAMITYNLICFNNANSSTTKVIKYNGNNLLVSVDGEYSNSIPSSGTYYLTSYKCNSSYTKVTWDNDKHQLSFSNGAMSGDISCNLNFSSKLLLSDVAQGSYVKYCTLNDDNSCTVNNANYSNDTNMGYCGYKGSKYYMADDDRKFIVNGWRVAYVEGGSAYLISAGAVMCGELNHENLAKVLDYCNSDYAYKGKCDENSVWAMKEEDFIKIDSEMFGNEKFKKLKDCSSGLSDKLCGYNNDLIDNGGYYWFDTSIGDDNYFWDADYRSVRTTTPSYMLGIRPVIKMSSSVYITGGDGTKENPYIIAKGRTC